MSQTHHHLVIFTLMALNGIDNSGCSKATQKKEEANKYHSNKVFNTQREYVWNIVT